MPPPKTPTSRGPLDDTTRAFLGWHAAREHGMNFTASHIAPEWVDHLTDANTLMPGGTKYADYANVHNYICRRPSIIDNRAWLNADALFHGWTDGIYAEYGKTWRKGFAGYSNADLVTLPRVTTETGWATGEELTG